MKRQAFQPGEIRDNNDNIIRPGAYGKKTALATSDNRRPRITWVSWITSLITSMPCMTL